MFRCTAAENAVIMHLEAAQVLLSKAEHPVCLKTWAGSLYPYDIAVTLTMLWQCEALLQKSFSSWRQNTLRREGSWPSPAIDADFLLVTWFRKGTISVEMAIYTAEDFFEPQVSAQNAWYNERAMIHPAKLLFSYYDDETVSCALRLPGWC